MYDAFIDLGIRIVQGTLPEIRASVKETFGCELVTLAKFTVPDGSVDQSFKLSSTANDKIHLLFITSNIYHATNLSYKIGTTSYNLDTPNYVRGNSIISTFSGDLADIKFTNSIGQDVNIEIYLLADSGVSAAPILPTAMPYKTGTFTVGSGGDYENISDAFSDLEGFWVDVTLQVLEGHVDTSAVSTINILGGELRITGDTRSLAGSAYVSGDDGKTLTSTGTTVTASGTDYSADGWVAGDKFYIIRWISDTNYTIEKRTVISITGADIEFDGTAISPVLDRIGNTIIPCPNRVWNNDTGSPGGGYDDPVQPTPSLIHDNVNLKVSIDGLLFDTTDRGTYYPGFIKVMSSELILLGRSLFAGIAYNIRCFDFGKLIKTTYGYHTSFVEGYVSTQQGEVFLINCDFIAVSVYFGYVSAAKPIHRITAVSCVFAMKRYDSALNCSHFDLVISDTHFIMCNRGVSGFLGSRIYGPRVKFISDTNPGKYGEVAIYASGASSVNVNFAFCSGYDKFMLCRKKMFVETISAQIQNATVGFDVGHFVYLNAYSMTFVTVVTPYSIPVDVLQTTGAAVGSYINTIENIG